jgi:hypothetical protein
VEIGHSINQTGIKKGLNMTANFLERYPSYTPKPGMIVQPDLWPSGGWRLLPGDKFDLEYFGTDLRIETGKDLIPSLPVKIIITGRKAHWEYNVGYRVRIKIEFCRDSEPSQFSGGWLYNDR